jgi:hypothetical protein
VILVFSLIPLVRWLIMSSIFQFFLTIKNRRKNSLQILWRCKKLKVQVLCVLLVYQFSTLEWQYRVLFGMYFGFASLGLMLVSHFLVCLHHFRRSILFWYVGIIVTYFCAALSPTCLTLSFSSLPDFIRWLFILK